MKKLIFSVVAILAITAVLLVLTDMPAATPFFSALGIIIGATIMGSTLYARLAEYAERGRNRQTMLEVHRLAAVSRAHPSAPNPPTIPSTSADELEYLPVQPLGPVGCFT